MGIKEGALALADELEAFEDGDCEECSLYGQPECKGHLSCMEIMARYAARKMREAVERDGEGATTVSAYDLLSDDDREAIAWVREMGGLGAVEKRLMPEGCEWPKHTDGELVRIGGCWGEDGCDTSITYIERIIFAEDGVYLDNEYNEVFCRYGERVKRPAPKVLDADGEEIREGDVLYSIETGDSVTVDSIEPGNPWVATTDGALQHCTNLTHRAPVLAADGEPLEVGQTVYATHYGYVKCTVLAIEWVVDGYLVAVENEGGHKFRQTPDEFTHQRLVLDADGVLIKEGDTVWSTRGSKSGTVVYAYPPGGDGQPSVKVGATWHHASDLTHTKPEQDTWERIERGIERGKTYTDELVLSIVRRCKALAERGE